MEPITSFFTFLILMAALFLLGAALYKCRGDISRWLNSRATPPNYNTRKVSLRRKLEDAEIEARREVEDIEAELSKIKEKEETAAEAKGQK